MLPDMLERHFSELIRSEGAAFRITTTKTMDSQAVKVPVIAPIPVECIFWPEADGWTGECTELSLTVRGAGFEEAKKNMESALQTYISRLIQETKKAA